jgi:hypothetical protein
VHQVWGIGSATKVFTEATTAAHSPPDCIYQAARRSFVRTAHLKAHTPNLAVARRCAAVAKLWRAPSRAIPVGHKQAAT